MAKDKHLAALLKARMVSLRVKSKRALAARLDTNLKYVKDLMKGGVPSKQMSLQIAQKLNLDQSAVDAAIKSDKERLEAKLTRRERGIFERPSGSGIWWVRYADQFSKEHREKVGPRQQALEVYQKRKTDIRAGKFNTDIIEQKHHDFSVSALIDERISRARAQNRASIKDIEQRLKWWRDYFKGKSARAVTSRDIELAAAEIAKGRLHSNKQKTLKPGGRAVGTVNRFLATLKTAFLDAVKDGKLTKHPFSKFKFAKENNCRIRYLSDEEEVRLLEVLPPEYHARVLMAAHTGLRLGEQRNVKREDIKQRILTVKKSKSGEARHIPLNDVAMQALQSIPPMINNPYVFYGRVAEKPLVTLVPKQWEKYLLKAGIKNFTWHCLRHTFASRLVMGGVDLYTVKILMGHHSIEQTQRYAHLAPSHLRKAVDVLVQPAPKPAPAKANAS